MNIVQTETLKGWGGQQNKVISECIALKNEGHNITLICNPNSKILEYAKTKNIHVIPCRMNKRNFLSTIPFFLRYIKKNNIDLIITHGSTDSWIGGLSARISSRKVISLRERHNLFPISNFTSRWLHHTVFTGIISISDAVSDYLKEIGVNENKIFNLPDSVDTKLFHKEKSDFREKNNIPSDAIVIGTLTALRKEKGVWDCCDTIIEIMQDEKIWFVFGGKNYTEIKNKIYEKLVKNNIDTSRIIWTGFRKDVTNILNSFDIFLYPSHSEGLGTILLEAMACSLPIIIYDIRPMSDLIINDKNGLSASFGNTKQLASHCIKLRNDSTLRNEFGKNNRDLIIEQYSNEALQNRMKKIVEKIS